MSFAKTAGLIAAPFTPFHRDGSLNLGIIPTYAKRLATQGVIGAFICGTTGEGMSLTTEERMEVAEAWMSAAPNGLRVIVHVGHTCLVDSQRLAQHAQEIGAHSFACMSPFFFKPNTTEDLVVWCEKVAAAAPKLPFYYYQIPSMTGVSLPVRPFLELAMARIPNLVGVKFTYENLEDFQACVEFNEQHFDLLFGRDELLLSALKLGARGAVGSTYNFAAPLYLNVIQAFQQGDEDGAAVAQRVASEMITTLVQGGPSPIATFKWFMQRLGLDCGPARLPLQSPTAQQIVALEDKLIAIIEKLSA